MKKCIYYCIIIALAIFSVSPFLIDPTHTGIDSTFHVANVADIAESIQLGNPFPKISLYTANGLGYGTHILYGQLPHYLTAYLYLFIMHFGLTVQHSIAMMNVIVAIASRNHYFSISITYFK